MFVQIVEFSPHKTSNFFNKLAFPHILMYFSNFAEKLLVWNCSKFFGTPSVINIHIQLRTSFSEHRRAVSANDANQPVAKYFNSGVIGFQT